MRPQCNSFFKGQTKTKDNNLEFVFGNKDNIVPKFGGRASEAENEKGGGSFYILTDNYHRKSLQGNASSKSSSSTHCVV